MLALAYTVLIEREKYLKCCYEQNKMDLKKKKATFVQTYLLTPWNRVLLEKLTGSAASQEIPRIFGTRKFITILISARHLSLS